MGHRPSGLESWLRDALAVTMGRFSLGASVSVCKARVTPVPASQGGCDSSVCQR